MFVVFTIAENVVLEATKRGIGENSSTFQNNTKLMKNLKSAQHKVRMAESLRKQGFIVSEIVGNDKNF